VSDVTLQTGEVVHDYLACAGVGGRSARSRIVEAAIRPA
jgi:hypothetical protein